MFAFHLPNYLGSKKVFGHCKKRPTFSWIEHSGLAKNYYNGILFLLKRDFAPHWQRDLKEFFQSDGSFTCSLFSMPFWLTETKRWNERRSNSAGAREICNVTLLRIKGFIFIIFSNEQPWNLLKTRSKIKFIVNTLQHFCLHFKRRCFIRYGWLHLTYLKGLPLYHAKTTQLI